MRRLRLAAVRGIRELQPRRPGRWELSPLALSFVCSFVLSVRLPFLLLSPSSAFLGSSWLGFMSGLLCPCAKPYCAQHVGAYLRVTAFVSCGLILLLLSLRCLGETAGLHALPARSGSSTYFNNHCCFYVQLEFNTVIAQLVSCYICKMADYDDYLVHPAIGLDDLGRGLSWALNGASLCATCWCTPSGHCLCCALDRPVSYATAVPGSRARIRGTVIQVF